MKIDIKRYKIYLISFFILSFVILIILKISNGNDQKCVMKKNNCDIKRFESITPRKVLFGNPDRIGVKLSHDGKYISYLAPYNGVMNVFVAPIDDIKNAEVVTFDKKRGINSYFWSYDNENIIYVQDKDGDENWHVYLANIKTKKAKDLTPIAESRSAINNVSHLFPHEILIENNQRDPHYFDLYKVNLQSGKLDLLYQNDKYGSLTTDDNFNLHFGHRPTQDGGAVIDIIKEHNKPSVFMTISPDDLYTTDIIGFDKSGNIIYLIDSNNRNTAALFSYDIRKDKKSLLFQSDIADVDGIMIHPIKKEVEGVAFTYDLTKRHFFDNQIKKEFDYLSQQHEGEITITSRTDDDKKWIIAYLSDNKAIEYYLYDRELQKLHYLFANRDDLKNYKLSRMHPVQIKSRDGLTMVSYLTIPSDLDYTKDNGVKSQKPVPLILLVHGGPTARDQWGYNSIHQWLANRGYAVLSVNYRGSTGFGKDFINAGNGEWAGKMHDDLIDAAEWAVKQNITTKDQIAIFGGSYGGYAALVALTFTPDFFACAVDIVGPSNLNTLLNSIPPYWKPYLHSLIRKTGGDPETEKGREFLNSRSPLTFVDLIKKPLLIGQGANDPRVKQQESDQIVKIMKEKNIPVTYVLYPDEGHGFARPENRIAFYAIAEQFLAQNLGGCFEPITDEISQSTTQIVEGSISLSANEEKKK